MRLTQVRPPGFFAAPSTPALILRQLCFLTPHLESDTLTNSGKSDPLMEDGGLHLPGAHTPSFASSIHLLWVPLRWTR